MDNDYLLIKQIKKFFRELKFKFNYMDLDIISANFGNLYIKNLIEGDKPFFVARGGAVEMRCIAEYLKRGTFSSGMRNEVNICAGVFPTDDNTLVPFCKTYLDGISCADLVVLWGVGAESTVVHSYCKNSKFTMLHAVEPYYFNDPWSASLKDKNILVIHPYKESIERQYSKRLTLFPNTNVLPEFKSLKCIKAIQSSAGEITNYSSWFDALKFMENQIKNIDFDVAIIGAGAYGLPLAAYCKRIGKKAIHMAGSTQLLFGIKGKRWDKHPIISKLYNDSWVRPLASETPVFKEKVEGGSYW